MAVERPTTQQGLGGLKTAFKGPQRQVQDKSYFLGLLRTKTTELNTEMSRLVKGIDKNNKEMLNLPALENKVKEMAVEITGGNKFPKKYSIVLKRSTIFLQICKGRLLILTFYKRK